MQRTSGDKARGARPKLSDPPRSSPAQNLLGVGSNNEDTFTGFRMLCDSVSNGEDSPPQFGDTPSTTRKYPGNMSLSVGTEYSGDLMAPISPSASLAQMRLNDSTSPNIPALSLEAVHEEDEHSSMEEWGDGVMFPPFDSGNR